MNYLLSLPLRGRMPAISRAPPRIYSISLEELADASESDDEHATMEKLANPVPDGGRSLARGATTGFLLR
jgi:hypothetical protein